MGAAIADLDRLVTAYARGVLSQGGDLVAASMKERLSPLLYDCFHRRGWPESISSASRRELRKAYYASAAHNVDLMDALSRTAAALAKRGIEAVAVKGADLATNIYPSVALRPMGDIDLWVSPDDADRAEDVLIGFGYRPWSPDMTPGLARHTRHARLFIGGNKNDAAIDLHWSLVGNPEDVRAPHAAWLRRNIRRDGPEPWSRLSLPAHLLYLAAHMKLQHYDEEIPLLWLIDFRLLAASRDMVWCEIFSDAEELGWAESLVASAMDVRERLDVSLPTPLARFVASFAPARSRLDGLHRPGGRQEPERIWNELRTLSWRARWRLSRALVLPSAAYMRFRYGRRWSWAWPLGYPLRWCTVLQRAATMLMKLVVRSRKRESRARPLLASRKHRET